MIKRFIRALVVYGVGIWFIATQIGGIEFTNPFDTVIYAAIGLTFAEMILKPIINLMLLPLNLVTLGTFRWVTNVLILYLATVLVPGFKIVEFTYRGFHSGAFIIPEMHLSLFMAFIIVSFVLSFISSILFWLSSGGGSR